MSNDSVQFAWLCMVKVPGATLSVWSFFKSVKTSLCNIQGHESLKFYTTYIHVSIMWPNTPLWSSWKWRNLFVCGVWCRPSKSSPSNSSPSVFESEHRDYLVLEHSYSSTLLLGRLRVSQSCPASSWFWGKLNSRVGADHWIMHVWDQTKFCKSHIGNTYIYNYTCL